MGYIYKIINKVTKKIYIGQTTQDLNERWKSHLKANSKCTYLSNSIKKYGKDMFDFKLICICFDEDLNRFEIEYIKKYNTISPNGYNIRNGGNNGKHHIDTKLKISNTLKEKYSNLKIIPNNGCYGISLSKEHKNKISTSLLGICKKLETKQKLREINIKYKVLQFTKGGLLINTYNSGVEAASMLGVNKGSISAACNGRFKTYKGFIWKYSTCTL